MKTWISLTRFVVLVCFAASALHAAEQEIDWNRARELHRRSQRGETLSHDETAYLDRARAIRATQARQRSGNRESPGRNRPAVQPPQHFTPLTELTDGSYKGQSGGLYGNGQNVPPETLRIAGLRESTQVKPLDEKGESSASGKVVLLSIGMSNTTQEFSQFKRIADTDPAKSSQLVIVDGAQGGQDAVRIANRAAPFWNKIDDRLKSSGVTPQQVQVVWIKQAIAGPSAGFPDEANRLQSLLEGIVEISKERYPNLRIAHLSSRIYAGYAASRLNPEPYAYESAFAVRGAILSQFPQTDDPNRDGGKMSLQPPILLWGPYLWADGLNPRKSDGLVWAREDLAADGTHPSNSGRQKVAEQLLKFFKTDPAARPWFLGKGGPPNR